MGNKLYVGNLNFRVTDTELRELFEQFGAIQYVKVIEQKGFGFVEFGSTEEAERALNEMNGKDFMGRTLKIDFAKPQERRDGAGGGDRGGFRKRY